MAEEIKNNTQSASPIIDGEIVPDKPEEVDFIEAMKKMMAGKKVTKLEWKDSNIYCYLSPATHHLTLHKEDGKDYDWTISEGDLNGIDWIELV